MMPVSSPFSSLPYLPPLGGTESLVMPSFFQALGVHPGVGVARVHAHRPVGVFGVQALFAGLMGLVPQGMVPAVADHPVVLTAHVLHRFQGVYTPCSLRPSQNTT